MIKSANNKRYSDDSELKVCPECNRKEHSHWFRLYGNKRICLRCKTRHDKISQRRWYGN
jgi:hypothetical protein